MPRTEPSTRFSLLMRLALAVLLLAGVALAAPRPAFAACGVATLVSDEAELAAAIEAHNAAAGPCAFIIQFDADITLTQPLPTITNGAVGVSLLVDGDGFTLTVPVDPGLVFDHAAGEIQDLTLVGVDARFSALYVTDFSGPSQVTLDGVTIRGFIIGADVAGTDNGLWVHNSTIEDNSTGLWTVNGALAYVSGSTLRNQNENVFVGGAELIVRDSLIAGGGGAGLVILSSTAEVINSTVWGNDIGVDAEDSNVTLVHATIAFNEDGLLIESFSEGAVVSIHNSLLARNQSDCRVNLVEHPGSVTFGSDHSLYEDTGDDACGLAAANPDGDGNIVGQPAQLGPLGDNGGPTLTAPLLVVSGSVSGSSPAIDAADEAQSLDEVGSPLSFDQRGSGFPRIVGDDPDMGAYEGSVSLVCPAFPIIAGDEAALNEAILCYNLATAPGLYTIELNADIPLSASTEAIDNSVAGVSLLLDGNTFALDGQDTPGVRPLSVRGASPVEVTDLTLTGGFLPNANGGGVYNEGDLTLTRVTVTENTTEENAGGIYNAFGATLLLRQSIVSLNLAAFPDGDGGGIDNAGAMTIEDSLIDSNTAEGDNLVIGGGILNEGVMVIRRSSVSGNDVDVQGDDGFEGQEGMGGGIANQANLIIRDSAVINNSIAGDYALFGGGVYSDVDPDAAFEDGAGAQLIIINSTLSGNSAAGQDAVFGGGLHARDSLDNCCLGEDQIPTVKLINITIAANFLVTVGDDVDGGGAYFAREDEFEGGLDVTVHNSIMADNTSGDCVLEGGPDFVSLHSLYEGSGDDACGLAAANPDADGNLVGVNPMLEPLGNNGGPTLTHGLVDNSPPVNSGDNDLAVDEEGDPLTADQRGFTPRIHNGNVDMGAYELGAGAPDGGGVFVSADSAGETDDGLPFGPHDILRWTAGGWSLWFDGSAAQLMPSGKNKHDINALWIPDTNGNDVVLSFTQNARFVPGITPKVDGMDLVWWDGDSFSLWFDGQDVGLTNLTGEKIDALHVLDGEEAPAALAASAGGSCDWYLLISLQAAGKVPNYSGGNLNVSGEDVLGFCMTQSGGTTAGQWIMVLKGKPQGMPKNSTMNLSASDDGETLYITTRGVFNVDGAIGGHSMVYEYDMATQSFSGPVWSAPAEGMPEKVDGLQLD